MKRLLAALVLLAMLAPAAAAPVLSASVGEVSVMLFDDPCALEQVGGRPYRRAQWIEGGAITEGCWGAVPLPGQPVVMFWFADRTLAVLPAGLFQRVGNS
jgi:hypothetical protein